MPGPPLDPGPSTITTSPSRSVRRTSAPAASRTASTSGAGWSKSLGPTLITATPAAEAASHSGSLVAAP